MRIGLLIIFSTKYGVANGGRIITHNVYAVTMEIESLPGIVILYLNNCSYMCMIHVFMILICTDFFVSSGFREDFNRENNFS